MNAGGWFLLAILIYIALDYFEGQKRLKAAEVAILKLESRTRILETEAWLARGLTPAQIARACAVDEQYVKEISLALRPTLSETRSRLPSALSARKDSR